MEADKFFIVMTFTVVLLLLDGTEGSRKGEENTGKQSVLVKVMSRISTHIARCMSGALHPLERCCCCLSLIQHKQAT